jgi:hypothetical protein
MFVPLQQAFLYTRQSASKWQILSVMLQFKVSAPSIEVPNAVCALLLTIKSDDAFAGPFPASP